MKGAIMLKTLTSAALLSIAGAAFAQGTPSVTPSDTPSVTPSQSPSVTPSQTPSITPSQTPSVTPSEAPVVKQTPITPPSAVGGLGKCENLIGTDKDKCLQDERAGAGTGSTAPGSTTSGTSTQPTAPIGSPTGTVR
jgi:hypothetical protein